MAALPTVGGDDGTWGTVLNEFLNISHNSGGTLKLPTVVVAAANTPSAQAVNANYICTGTSGSRTDHTTINLAVSDVAAAGGEVLLLPGTYYAGAKVVVAGTGAGSAAKQICLRFAAGATLNGAWATAVSDIILSIESWNVDIFNPTVTGSGSKGNGIGIAFGSAVSTVHNCTVYSPRISSCDTGIEFGIFGSSSSGDNVVFGGYLSACTTGIKSKGFVNYVYGPFISGCTKGILVTEDRPDSRINVYGATILSCSGTNSTYIEVLRGYGSSFYDLWMESSISSETADYVRLGASNGAYGYSGTDRKASGVSFKGTTLVGPGSDGGTTTPPNSIFRLVSCENLTVESLQISNNNAEVSGFSSITGIIVEDSTSAGNNNRFKRIQFSQGTTGNIPSWYVHSGSSSKLLSKSGTGEVICEAIPAPAGFSVSSGNAGLVGELVVPSPHATYTLGQVIDSNTGIHIYFAKKPNGHIAAVVADDAKTPAQGGGASQTISGLKTVVENLLSKDVHYHFSPDTWDFGYQKSIKTKDVSVLGYDGLAFSGAGIDTTILQNFSVGTQDIEPLSFENCWHMTIRDMTISAGGTYPSSVSGSDSSDAIDSDHACYSLIERVKIIASRDRGIVFDGKDLGATANADGQTTLNGAINTTDTTITLTSVSQFPSPTGNTYRQFPFFIIIDGEIIEVNGVSGSTFVNCRRGRKGGDAAELHSNGATVQRWFEATDNIIRDVVIDGHLLPGPTTAPSTSGSTSGGSMNNTNVQYAVSYIYNDYRESVIGIATSNVSTNPSGGSGSVSLTSIPTGSSSVVGRKIYRKSAETTDWYLTGIIWDNSTTTFSDTNSDSTITTAGSTTIYASNPPAGGAAAVTDYWGNVVNAGIELLAADRNLITGCIITGTGTNGIRIRMQGSTAGSQTYKHPSENVILGNLIHDVGSDGIKAEGCKRNTIAHNISRENGGRGINLAVLSGTGTNGTIDDNIISGNIVTSNGSAGISLLATTGSDATSTANRNVIINNMVRGNTTDGIKIADATRVADKTFISGNIAGTAAGSDINVGAAATNSTFGSTSAVTPGDAINPAGDNIL